MRTHTIPLFLVLLVQGCLIDQKTFEQRQPEFEGDGDADTDADTDSDTDTDTDSDADTDTDTDPVPVSQLDRGDIVISEIMVDPDPTIDASGEWFELTNTTDKTLDLYDLRLLQDGTERGPVAKHVLVEPNGRSVFSSSQSGAGLDYDYYYFFDASVVFQNTGDNLSIAFTGGNGIPFILDEVEYDSSWPVVPGASLQLDPDAMDPDANDSPSSWCPTNLSTWGTNQEYGSPGDPNEQCD